MLERRGFVAGLTVAIAGVIAAVLGVPLAGYTILPALRRRPEEWHDAGPVDRLSLDEPKAVTLALTVKDGWRTSSSAKTVWAIKQASGAVTVYSGHCPHLGCGFRWEPARHAFLCPCHLGLFALDGRVLGGPPPRPLDTLPAKVEGGRLFIIYREFKAGATAKIEL